MKIYWSYTQFPDLAGYDARQKKIIWLNLTQWRPAVRRRSWLGFLIPTVIISSFLAGITIGCFTASNIERGGFIGGLMGVLIPAPMIYLFGINSRRGLLRQYLKSIDFIMLPMNVERQVRARLNPSGR